MVFETSNSHSSPDIKPIQVPTRREDIFAAAKEMIADMQGWEIVETDEDGCRIVYTKSGGIFGGSSTIEVRVEGPDGIPSSIVNVKSTTAGGLLKRDKSNVAEFVRPFLRRVC